MIDADQRYARHVTLAEDLRILAATVPVVLFRRGFFVADRSEASTEDVEPDPA
jgi:lipopolysaccharide/colanic/teichoic acid biosynthesis glycosyltransferase